LTEQDSPSPEIKFLVLGAGAIGTYLGGSLALHGYPVDVACEVLPKAAEIAMGQHGLVDEVGTRYIPRRWLEITAVKPG